MDKRRLYAFLPLLLLTLLTVAFFFFDLPLSHAISLYSKELKPLAEVMSLVINQALILSLSVVLFFVTRFFTASFSFHLLFFHLLVSQCIGQLLLRILKVSVARARPFVELSNGHNLVVKSHFIDTFHSFPSGHSLVVFILAGSLSYQWPHYKWIFFIGATFFALSRFMLLEHFLSDITASLILALLITHFIHYFSYQIVSNDVTG